MTSEHSDSELTRLISGSNLLDLQWYQAVYPDVAASHMTPLTHFVRFGLPLYRDPGPAFSSTFFRHAFDPDHLGAEHPFIHRLCHPHARVCDDLVLHAAMQVLLQGRPHLAERLALRHLPKHLHHTIAAVAANKAWLRDDAKAWQDALNRYLAYYGMAPIVLQPADTRLGQLQCKGLDPIATGPLISVIMPVWNAEKTLEIAIRSIFDQTWKNLELIAVDDASTDKSWRILQELAMQDPRLKPIRNSTNVGPYVAKNIGLQKAHGRYVTGHDADDWAHPQRLAKHIELIHARSDPLPVTMPYGLRMRPDGLFHHTRRAGAATSFDGWMQSTPIGTVFDADFLKNRLGHWDSVRFGADTEILLRARHVIGKGSLEVPLMSMICLDAPGSLSNDAQFGTRAEAGGLSLTRRRYLQSVHEWLLNRPRNQSVFLDFPQDSPRYGIPYEMRVTKKDILRNLS